MPTLSDRALPLAERPLPPLADRLFATGAELAAVPAFVVTALNSNGALGFLATQPIKIGATGLAVAAAAVVLARGRARPRFPIFFGLVATLLTAFLLTSLLRGIPVSRFLLFGQYTALVLVALAWMAVRPERLVTVLYSTSLAHLVLARVFPTSEQWEDGLTRLGGGSHPITLGFEAAMVLVVSIIAALGPVRTHRRVLLVGLGVYGLYILEQAFSRQSLIATAVAVVVLAIAVPGPFRWVRALAAIAVAFAVVALLGGDGIASLLGANDLSDLSTATGRTDIWARVLPFLPLFAPLGFGFASLNDPFGPDTAVYFASNGETAENAILQVLLDIGVWGTAIWAVLLVAGFIVLLRSRGPSRVLALASLPLFLSSILVASSLGDGGMQWWWFLALVGEASASVPFPTRRSRAADAEVPFDPVAVLT